MELPKAPGASWCTSRAASTSRRRAAADRGVHPAHRALHHHGDGGPRAAVRHPGGFLYRATRTTRCWRTRSAASAAGYGGRRILKDDIRAFISALKNNECVWYAPDQSYRKKGAEMVPMFGIPAATNTLTSRLAGMTGAAVLPYFFHRLPGTQGYRADHPSRRSRTSRATARWPTRERFNHMIEAQVRHAPRAIPVDSPPLQGASRGLSGLLRSAGAAPGVTAPATRAAICWSSAAGSTAPASRAMPRGAAVGAAVRAGRPRRAHLLGQHQADPRRPALPRGVSTSRWCARRCRSARCCSPPRRTSCGRCASSCRTPRTCARRG